MGEQVRRPPEIDPQETCTQIESWLQTQMADMGRDGAILGISGGLDSSVVAHLTVRALGADKVRLLNLPDRDSRPVHRQHADLVARTLGVRLETRDLTPALRAMGVYRLLPLNLVPGRRLREKVVNLVRNRLGVGGESVLEARFRPAANSLVAKGNAYAMAKRRLQMAWIYKEAETANLMVVGAANRTEWLTGTFAHWGCDHCADAMPIVHLYRSQLPPLAEYLGVPLAVRGKAADPDVLPGVDDKGTLLGSFPVADEILWALERDDPTDALAQRHGEELVARIQRLYTISRYMRETPYSLRETAP